MKPLSLLSIFSLLLITFKSIGQSENYSDLHPLERSPAFTPVVGVGVQTINVNYQSFNFRFEDETGNFLFEDEAKSPQNQTFIGFDLMSNIYWKYRYFINFGGQFFYSFEKERASIVQPSIGGGYLFYLTTEKRGNMPRSWLETSLSYSFQLIEHSFYSYSVQRGDGQMQVNGEKLLPDNGWVESYSLQTNLTRHMITPTFKINHLVSDGLAIYARLQLNIPFAGRHAGIIEAEVKEGRNVREQVPIKEFNLTSNGRSLTKPTFTPMFANFMVGVAWFVK